MRRRVRAFRPRTKLERPSTKAFHIFDRVSSSAIVCGGPGLIDANSIAGGAELPCALRYPGYSLLHGALGVPASSDCRAFEEEIFHPRRACVRRFSKPTASGVLLRAGWYLAKVRGSRYKPRRAGMALSWAARHWKTCRVTCPQCISCAGIRRILAASLRKHTNPLVVVSTPMRQRFRRLRCDLFIYTYAKYGSVLKQPGIRVCRLFDARSYTLCAELSSPINLQKGSKVWARPTLVCRELSFAELGWW